MSWEEYRNLRINVGAGRRTKGKYSVTGDILSFQICRRQYGFYAIRDYQPAHLVQIWFGTIIHQVLDKLHNHYSGLLDPNTRNQIPNDADIEIYFNQIEESLRAKGIKAINQDLRETALRVLKRFNRIEGAVLYPNVIDTECELQSDQGDYILHGKVDVLKNLSVGRKIRNYNLVEIWDYKGSKFPDTSSQEGFRKLQRYIFQMLAYARLYRLKEGRFPLKGVLYFLNELDTDIEPIIRPTYAIHEIDFRSPLYLDHMDEAMKLFSHTVEEIEQCVADDIWNPPETNPDSETCDICDLRWDCLTVRNRYPMRHP